MQAFKRLTLAFISILTILQPVFAILEEYEDNVVLVTIADFGGVPPSGWFYVPMSIIILSVIFYYLIYRVMTSVEGARAGEDTDKNIAIIVGVSIACISVFKTGFAAFVYNFGLLVGLLMLFGAIGFAIYIGYHRAGAAASSAKAERLTKKTEKIQAKKALELEKRRRYEGMMPRLEQAEAAEEARVIPEIEDAARHLENIAAGHENPQDLPTLERELENAEQVLNQENHQKQEEIQVDEATGQDLTADIKDTKTEIKDQTNAAKNLKVAGDPEAAEAEKIAHQLAAELQKKEQELAALKQKTAADKQELKGNAALIQEMNKIRQQTAAAEKAPEPQKRQIDSKEFRELKLLLEKHIADTKKDKQITQVELKKERETEQVENIVEPTVTREAKHEEVETTQETLVLKDVAVKIKALLTKINEMKHLDKAEFKQITELVTVYKLAEKGNTRKTLERVHPLIAGLMGEDKRGILDAQTELRAIEQIRTEMNRLPKGDQLASKIKSGLTSVIKGLTELIQKEEVLAKELPTIEQILDSNNKEVNLRQGANKSSAARYLSAAENIIKSDTKTVSGIKRVLNALEKDIT